MKVILNKCYGGFRPSVGAYMLYAKKKGMELYPYKLSRFLGSKRAEYKRVDDCFNDDIFVDYFTKDFGDVAEITDDDHVEHSFYLCGDYREDPTLIEVVEELGGNASSRVSKLTVVEIPDGMDYVIDDYDGVETLHQRVKVW